MPDLKMGLLGEFNTILYDEEPLKPQEYLNGVNKSTLLKLASFMLGLSPNTSKFNDWKELLHMWFRAENKGFANKIWQRCIALEKSNNTTVSLLSPVASLKFFEFIFALPEIEVSQDEITSEINLFKAYLLFLTNTTKNETLSKEYLENLDSKLRAPATLLNQTYPVADLSNYELGDIFITQLVKAYLLFEFLEKTHEAKRLLDAFYKYFQIHNWKEYFQFLLPIIQAHTKHPSEGWTQLNILKDENFERNSHFLEALSLKEFDTELDFDFKLLRSKPIYKVDEGLYVIISPLFVFEKIYKGLYFKLNEIHNSLPIEQKSIKNLRSFYTSKFSENYLLYKILEHIYGKRNYVKFSGMEIKRDGAPDYYIRSGNHIFLFENKDIFINAEIKQSSNFELIEAEFKKKLFFEKKDSKIEDKAVLQIVNNIRLILSKKNSFDTGYKEKNIKIYPLLILQDSSFNSPGFNFLINYWFEIELKILKDEGLDISRIRPLTVINIDTLILYSDFLKLKKVTLNELIEAYIKYCTFNDKKQYKNFEHFKMSYANTLLSFSFFIDKHTNVGFKGVHPELVNKVMHAIIK